MNKKRVLLFCDSKWRDLPGISLLRKHLLHMGYSVYVTHLHAWRETVDAYAPHLVVLNHVQGSRNGAIASHVRRNGGHVLVQFTEGILEFEGRKELFSVQKDNQYVDHFLCWNEETAQLVNGRVMGCPRFDIYQDKYDYLVDGAGLTRERHGLTDDVPMVLFVDSWPSEKFTYSYQTFHQNDFKDLGNTATEEYSDPAKFARAQREFASKFRHGILSVQQYHKNDFEYVVKTHPMSDLAEWNKWGRRHGINIIHRDYIFNLIDAADLVVGKLGSITIPETWMRGVPVATLDFNPQASGATEEQRSAQGAFNFKEITPDIVDVIESPAGNFIVDQMKYLDKWGLSSPDETESSLETAKLIDEMLLDSDLAPLGEPDFIKLTGLQLRTDNGHSGLDAFGNWHKTVTHADVLAWGRKLNANS